MRGSLTFFWRRHLAVAAGAGLACAVLTGALLVGDSVRGSLRALALDRLGPVEAALVSPSPFRQRMAAELNGQPDLARRFQHTVPLVLLPATAVHADSRARASKVTLHGVEGSFPELFGAAADAWSFAPPEGSLFPPVVLNHALQQELGAEVGDSVLFSFRRSTEVPRASLLGRRETSDVVQTLRLTVAAVVPDSGPGAFTLAPNQSLPLNAFMPLAELQRATRWSGQVNALLMANWSPDGERDGSLIHLGPALRRVLQLEDLGLRLLTGSDTVTVESRQYVLADATVEAVNAAAAELGAPQRPYLTYLANRIELVGAEGTPSGNVVPYSTVTALGEPPPGVDFGQLTLTSGEPAPALQPGEILLNTWAVEQLGNPPVGSELDLSYYVVGDREQLSTAHTRFRLAGVVAIAGLAADAGLTPEYPGISDSPDIASWDPPFPVDLSLVGQRDEEYWDRYRGTPKAFVSLADGQRLWSSRFGSLSAVRLQPPAGMTAEQLAPELERVLLRLVELPAYGFEFQPVRERALEASQGASSFGMLFLGFSWFLIVAALLLVVLLFRLGVEQRAREVGLLRALGFPEPKVRRRFLAEGVILASLGAAGGVLGGVGYAAALMAALRTWWLPAVGSEQLYLHVHGSSLALGFGVALVLTAVVIFLTLRRLRRVPVPVLLAGSAQAPEVAGQGAGQSARWLTAGGAALALLLAAVAWLYPDLAPALFFGVGSSVLVAGLAAFSLWCRYFQGGMAVCRTALTQTCMAMRNSARNAGRSILSVILVASACFVLVAVAANQRQPGGELQRRDSGAGGLALVGESDLPLYQDLSRPEGRRELALPASAENLLGRTHIYPFRLLPGDDASCLNLFQPKQPRVLGVPAEFIERGGFSFQQTSKPSEHPWHLLQEELGGDPETGVPVLPAIGDFETAMWILKVPLGGEVELQDDFGRPVRLRVVGLLKSSIFQSELLISEAQMLRHFPSVEGYRYFLAETPPEEVREVSDLLEGSLEAFGFDAVTTAQKLARYKAVQNTYLSTFQTLGGLGLLLGTLGLAIVLVRNVGERRGELAALRAFGFRRRVLVRLVLVENVFLLVLGIALGTLSALVAVAPYLISGGNQLPWSSLALTLGAILGVGVLTCAVASVRALRAELIPALRGL